MTIAFLSQFFLAALQKTRKQCFITWSHFNRLTSITVTFSVQNATKCSGNKTEFPQKWILVLQIIIILGRIFVFSSLCLPLLFSSFLQYLEPALRFADLHHEINSSKDHQSVHHALSFYPLGISFPLLGNQSAELFVGNYGGGHRIIHRWIVCLLPSD